MLLPLELPVQEFLLLAVLLLVFQPLELLPLL